MQTLSSLREQFVEVMAKIEETAKLLTMVTPVQFEQPKKKPVQIENVEKSSDTAAKKSFTSQTKGPTINSISDAIKHLKEKKILEEKQREESLRRLAKEEASALQHDQPIDNSYSDEDSDRI